MTRIAFLSDVHGNANAFEAVLEDIASRGIDKIVNMGDVIGYGPEPERCIDLALENCPICLKGNHEYAILNSAEGFNPVAKGAVEFVRNRLMPGENSPEEVKRRWNYVNNLEVSYLGENVMATHASPRHEVMEYVLPSDPEMDPLKLDEIFEMMPVDLALVGHTHYPGVIEERSENFIVTGTIDNCYKIRNGTKAIVNVGSVGQPRDRDVRACYVELNGDEVYFHRVEYNVQDTVDKIHSSGALHESLGYRLLEGR
jgi:predicted phosphodiesterase